jgi:hypothetical protein
MSDIAVVRPERDIVEDTLSDWAELVLAGVSGAGRVPANDLKGSSVTQSAVEILLKNNDVTIYFGHGDRDRLGSSTSCLIDAGNISEAAGRVVIAIACKAASDLGPDAVSSGNRVRAFLGFDDVLVVYLRKPSLFGRAVESAIIPFLLSGSSIADAHSTLVKEFQAVETCYRDPKRGGRDHDANIIWMAAHINWRGTQLLGDRSATVP